MKSWNLEIDPLMFLIHMAMSCTERQGHKHFKCAVQLQFVEPNLSDYISLHDIVIWPCHEIIHSLKSYRHHIMYMFGLIFYTTGDM